MKGEANMSRLVMKNNNEEILLNLMSDEWVRAEFLKQKVDGQFVNQFNLEVFYNEEASLKSLINENELTIQMTAENGTIQLTNAEISQYSIKLTRDGQKIIERIVFDGLM